MAEIVVCGAGFVGLTAGLLLARDGHRVTVLEADPAPPPADPDVAWSSWTRAGVAQFRQPHNAHARVRQVLDEELPGATDALLDAGCVGFNPLDALPPTLADGGRPGDDQLRVVTGRRPVMEAALARFAASAAGPAGASLRVRRGAVVTGLLTRDGSARAGPRDRATVPHVTGVRLDGGEELRADLVVDATGRRSRLAEWLAAVGGAAPALESEDSGFVYYSRFYRGAEPPRALGPPIAAIGTFSILYLPGDSGTWSVTVWASAADGGLRGLREADRFTRLVAACPLQAHWLGGDPITDVVVAAGVLDRWRRFVVDDRPVVTGLVAVGDAWAATNPSAGRGLSIGLIHAQQLRDTVRAAGAQDPDALVRQFAAVTESEVYPYVRDQITADRARVAEMDAPRAGRDPDPPDPLIAATLVAMAQDPDVFRAVLQTIMCLELPERVLSRPAIAERILPYIGQAPGPVAGPDRAELLRIAAG